MNSNQVNGTVDEVVGSIKRKAGKLTGNTQLQVKGIAQQAKGKIESVVGNAKDMARDGDRKTRARQTTSP
jgi:uncharacterized protein YjbJ (UPF0337 family)